VTAASLPLLPCLLLLCATNPVPPPAPIPACSGSPSPAALATLREIIVEQAAKGKRILVRRQGY